MDRFSGRDDGDKAAPRSGQGQIARGGLHAFVKSASTMGGIKSDQQSISGPSVTLSRSEQAQKLKTAETAKRVSEAVAAAVAADPRPHSGFQPPKWAAPPPAGLVLQGRKGGEVVQNLALSKLAVLIGRLDTADLQLEHASTSRQHAVICFRPDGTAVVMDLNSAHGTFLDGKRMPKHTPLMLEEGQEVRFGASTRAFFLCREDATISNGASKKRNVQWPDESQGGPRKKVQPDLETVIGFSDGGNFSAGVGPAAATEKQGRFASVITPVTRPSPRQAVTSAGADNAPRSPTEAAAEATGGTRAGLSRPPPACDEDKAAALKRLAAERFRQFMQSNSQKQSSFYDELPPPSTSTSSRTDASSPPPN